jgi:hypothetical protein
MKLALLFFVAAAAFAVTASVGVWRLDSAQHAPAVIVLLGHDRGAASARARRAPRSGHTEVRQQVEHATLSTYRARRARKDRP